MAPPICQPQLALLHLPPSSLHLLASLRKGFSPATSPVLNPLANCWQIVNATSFPEAV
jgi:hypothetical protein